MASLTRRIAEGTFFLTGEKFITNTLGLVNSLLIIKALGQYQYGLFVLGLSVVAMTSSFLDLGLGLVISSDLAVYRGKNELGKVKKLIKDFFTAEIIIGITLVIFIFVLSLFVVSGYTIRYLIYIALGILFLNALRNVFLTTIYGFTRLKTMAVIQPIEMIIKLFLIIVILFFLGKGLLWALAIQFLASLVVTIISGIVFINIVLSLRQTKSATENLLFNIIKTHGKWQMLSSPVKSVFENIRFWVIKYLLDVNAVAIFRVAEQMVNYLLKVIGALEAVLLPILAERIATGRELVQRIMFRSMKYSIWLSLILGLVGFFAVPYLLVLFFEEKYVASILLFQIMLLRLPGSGFGVAFRPIFFSLRRQKSLLKFHIISNLVAYPISILLIILYSFNGFALPIGSYTSIYLRYRELVRSDEGFRVDFKRFFIFDNYDKELLRKVLIKIKQKIF